MRLTILFLLVSICSFGQVIEKKSISGRPYLVDFKGDQLPTIIYLCGSGEIGSLSKIKNVAFYTSFYNAFKNDFNFFIPMQYAGLSGWENMINGYTSGGQFTREMIAEYNLTKVVVTGHSAGATWETLAFLQDQIQGFAPVAGRGLSYQLVVNAGRKNIPVNAWHGEKDTAWPNTYTAGKQACLSWFRDAGNGKPIWNSLPGVGHGSDKIAYATNSGLREWILGLFIAVEPPLPEPKDLIDSIYTDSSDSITFIFKSGKILKR
jgi:hypothetical protein